MGEEISRPTSAARVITTTILCKVRPQPAAELERWLVSQLDSLQGLFPKIVPRLDRLSQVSASDDEETGWLITLDLTDASLAGNLRFEAAIDDLLRDMRFLGIAATTLVPADGKDRPTRHSGGWGTDRALSVPDDGEAVGAASFPASDPPAAWTWEHGRD
jgi:hypothetical protein